ncbi:hypothetical protein [Kitasatospora sp. LaBMicrA B282]
MGTLLGEGKWDHLRTEFIAACERGDSRAEVSAALGIPPGSMVYL